MWAYSAFGDNEPTTAANRFGASGAGTTGATPVVFNLRYPGQYYDKESGLYYNYFRSYSPTSGRYTQADPIGLDGGWNRFGYVDANPLMYTDPEGLIKVYESEGGVTFHSYPGIKGPAGQVELG